jgi:hypothetical protein
LAVPRKDFVVLLTKHEMDGEYLGPLKKMLEGNIDFEKGM